MHNPVSNAFDRSEHRLRFEPIQQKGDRGSVIARIDGATVVRLSGRVIEGQIRAAQADAVYFAIQQPPQWVAAPIVQCEPDAG
jgi:hypothetical protein